ncbi:P-loop containing nucleoside triphosphate hydrolase protein [Clavulina sp. PMI_390]|nr:P-loop containing nucleoside triphosphate hydrolase protein [Clavulina sp. PMI_390]
MDFLPPALRQSQWLYPALALVVALASILLVTLFRSRTPGKVKSGNSILLLGPSDSGKTAILTRLTYGQFLPTHTSLQTNQTVFTPEGASKPYNLADIPGHPRIRAQFTEALDGAKGIVFVVDSSTIARNGATVAEHLHSVLHAITQLPPSAHTPSILIMANKADLVSASSSSPRETVAAERVRMVLERELEKRRQSSLTGVGVGGLGENDNEADEGAIQGGLETMGDGPFSFAKWEGGEVTIAGGFVDKQTKEKLEAATEKGEVADDGLANLHSWLEGL